MSRSYRRPFVYITGLPSSHASKKAAARGVRHRQNTWLRRLDDFDGTVLPHRWEGTENDVWTWARDGQALFVVPGNRRHSSEAESLAFWRRVQRK